MRREPGGDDPLYRAKPANHAHAGIRDRDPPERCLLVKTTRLDFSNGSPPAVPLGAPESKILKHLRSSDTSNL